MERRLPTTLAIDCSNGGLAALAVNGTLVAAASETCAARCGERHPQPAWTDDSGSAALAEWLDATFPATEAPLPRRAAAACLGRARLAPDRVERIVIVETPDGPRDSGAAGVEVTSIEPARARAWQLAATTEDDGPSLVVSDQGDHSVLFRWCHGNMTPVDGPGIGDISAALSRVARTVGSGESFDALDRFSSTRNALAARPEHQAHAAAFCGQLTATISAYVTQLLTQFGVRRVGLVGGMFSSEGLRTRLADALGDAVAFAPFAEPLAPVAGAALAGVTGPRTPLRSLALGPVLSEADVKATLDNCRLDYVYEPDWERLLRRASRMLSRGNVVAWFSGPAPFGVQPDASRAILCDPSKPFARDNINRFLRLGELNDPLTVFLPADTAHDVIAAPVLSPLTTHRATPRPGFRDQLRASLDPRGQVSVQVVDADSRLYRLLQLHRQETGVPGLIASALGTESIACSPREAVRTTFSSAVDALVIERFLVMKDWWLLRSEG